MGAGHRLVAARGLGAGGVDCKRQGGISGGDNILLYPGDG